MGQILIVYLLIFIMCCANVFAKHKKPTIYPQKQTIVVDSGTDLTLGCVGKEPVKWTFYDPMNKASNNSIVAESMLKSTNNKYNYGLLLTVLNVSYLNIGYYCCHGKMVEFVNPTRSNEIFVYVRDEQRLSFFPMDVRRNSGAYNSIIPVPCRPTSPDVNVSLIIEYLMIDKNYSRTLNQFVQLYSNRKVNKNEFPKEGIVDDFNPIFGLVVRLIAPWVINTCIFKRNNITEFMVVQLNTEKYETLIPYIDGPDLIIVQLGEDLSLNCTIIVNYEATLKWSFPNSSTSSIVNLPPVQLVRFNQLLISTLTIKKIAFENEGEYECISIAKNANTESLQSSKYIAVVDKTIKSMGPKIIYPEEKEIQVNAKENFTLICEGSRPITWSYPNEYYIYQYLPVLRPSKKVTKNDVAKYETNSRNGTTIYTAFLQLKSVHNLNTGFYYCHENSTVKNNPYKSDSVYMFVKDTEDLQATDTRITKIMFFTKNSNVTIPCRPSAPDVNVKLRIENYTSISKSYDSRFGFIVNMTTDKNYIDVYCIFELNGYIKASRYKFQHSKFFMFATHTYIAVPEKNIVYIGEEFNLFCRVVISNNNIFKTIIWDIPNPNRTDIDVSYSSIPIHGGKVLISKLTIKDTQLEDEGLYNCYLPKNTDFYNRMKLKYISVLDKFDVVPSINGLKNNRTYFGAEMILYCDIEVDHNSDFNINWNVPNVIDVQNKELMTTYIEYIPNLYGIIGRSALKIKNVTFENQGNYTCTALDSFNHTKIAVLDVTIQNTTKPKIIDSNMNGSTIDIAIGQSVELICMANGIPSPQIIWKKDETVVSKDNNTFTISFMKPWDVGQYSCNASSHVGWDFRKINLNIPSDELIRIEILIVIFCVILIMIIILSAILIVKRKKELALRNRLIKAGILNFETGEIQSLNPKMNINEQALLLPYDRKWDIPTDRIKLGKELGFGNYGIVLQAEVFGIFRGETIKTVAVKMVKSNFDFVSLNSLISELKIMTHIGRHINIVNLLGACTENITTRQLMVIVEYCKYGNVQNYLLKNRRSFIDLINSETGLIEISTDVSIDSINTEQSDSITITTLDLVRWAFQVARGMEYLASRKILHADLAARNILLADDNIVKISDFGLSKNLRRCTFYKKKYNKGPMPIKWMAIEAIRDGIFSMQSDVWSYGIVLWEFFSLGRTPYPEMETNFTFYHKICEGYRMDQPQYSTKEIYQIMLECWQTKPICRPSFTELVGKLRSVLQQTVHEDYMELDESDEIQDIPDFFANFSSPDYLSVMSNHCNVESNSTQEFIPMDNVKTH